MRVKRRTGSLDWLAAEEDIIGAPMRRMAPLDHAAARLSRGGDFSF
jgi:hypothetical protein